MEHIVCLCVILAMGWNMIWGVRKLDKALTEVEERLKNATIIYHNTPNKQRGQ